MLKVQGGVMGVESRLSLPDLEHLAAYLAQVAAAWRASLVPDYYTILGVARTATAAEIQQAWRALCKQHHPDTTDSDGARLTLVNAAYEVLSDPTTRQQYDANKED
jgi:DnaJ-domain-containing protein 1